MTRRIALAGLRASGKSTVAQAIGHRLGWEVIELDAWTAEELGASSPAAALNELGVTAFREGETCALRRALDAPPSIISLGGGTPTAPGASDLLRNADCTVVYLRAQPETLRKRLGETDVEDRPSLTGAGTLEEVDVLFEQRDAAYRSLGITIDVDELGVEQVCDAVLLAIDT